MSDRPISRPGESSVSPQRASDRVSADARSTGESPIGRIRTLAATVGREVSSPVTLALAATLPPVFLHVEHQPGFDFSVGSTRPHLALSDLAVLALGVLATAVALRRRGTPLRSAVPLAIPVALFLGWILASCFYPLLGGDPYAWRTHLLSAGKYAEYVLLAWAVIVLVRRRADLDLVAWAIVLWSVAASVVGLLQMMGWHVSSAWPAGRRQPSFLGHHDLAALSGTAASIAVVAIALPAARVDRRLAIAGGVSGVTGLIVSGSSAGAIGFTLAAAAAAIVVRRSWRRVAAIVAIAAVAIGGVVLLRGGDIANFVHLLGIGKKEQQTGVESYTQRTLLVYIGWRIFLDHPAAGVGWDGSSEQWAYDPYLADAHREFPSSPELSFPSPAHPWGVQNAYIQALADLGIVGLLAFLGLFATVLVAAGRRALRAPPETALVALLSVCWLLVAMGVVSATGNVAGLPVDGVLWLAVGLAVTATAGLARART